MAYYCGSTCWVFKVYGQSLNSPYVSGEPKCLDKINNTTIKNDDFMDLIGIDICHFRILPRNLYWQVLSLRIHMPRGLWRMRKSPRQLILQTLEDCWVSAWDSLSFQLQKFFTIVFLVFSHQYVAEERKIQRCDFHQTDKNNLKNKKTKIIYNTCVLNH